MLGVLAFGAFLLCVTALGRVTLLALRFRREHTLEFETLSATAGLGVFAVFAALLGLAGAFSWTRWVVVVGAVTCMVWFAARYPWRRPMMTRPSNGALIVAFMLTAAVLGAIPPVTESDSLAYPIPIAQRVAQTGMWRFWPDLARAVYPPAQQFLSATLMNMGVTRVGLLSAVELVLATLLLSLLASRVASHRSSSWLAPIIAFGCPAVALLAGSAKEDLLLVAMTLAGALALFSAPSVASAAVAGLFAGMAAGSKYTGIPVCLAVLACVPFCCGRQKPARSLVAAGVAAAAAGGLWYVVNIVRFGNPVVPMMPSIGHFPGSPLWSEDIRTSYGYGRTPLDALLVPIRATLEVVRYDVGEFGGRGNWINPMIWLGLPYALAGRARLTRYWPLLAIALAVFLTWFGGTQIIRLLLPTAALLSIPAADGIAAACQRFRPARYAAGLAIGLSAGIVVAFGLVRFERYVVNPSAFVRRETEHYDAIEWMNTHLDPKRDRVATRFRSSAYLTIPWINLGWDYQVEITDAELRNPVSLRSALKRQGITHLFGQYCDLEGLEPWLDPVHADSASRLGGVRFFRSPPTQTVAVFAIR